MGEQMISAERDDSSPTAVSIYGTETAEKGARRNTELWHIPRELESNRPLCGANLAGRFKRSKGIPNCTQCRNLASLGSVYDHHHPVLRALYLDEPVPAYRERYYSHDPLYDADLVADKGGRMVLTTRGKVVALDIVRPVGWLDTRTRLYHARRPLELDALCGAFIGTWDTRLEAFTALQEAARKHGRRTVTCVRCVVHPDHRADVG